MFTTLLIKEWKDKAVIALFGLVMMTAFTAAFVALDGQDDLRELLAAGFLSVFFPAIGAILGAGAFESEFRDGAWAYLLSRPVRKETVWLAKLAALLSVLAGYGLIFLGLTAAVPGLGVTIAGYKLPGIHGLILNMPPLVLFTSVFFFSVAFALSLLSEKLLSLVLGSIFLGSLVQAALTQIAFRAEGRGLLSKAGLYPWLDAYKLALVLSGLAFLAASLLTFRRVDFSQPKRKAASLAKHSALFLIAAWFLAALWPTLRPGRPEELASRFTIVEDNAYFATTRGFYRYDLGRGSLKKMARWHMEFGGAVIRGGKVLVSGWTHDGWERLIVMNLDGAEKRTLLGPGIEGSPVNWNSWGLSLSPDGRRAAFVVLDQSRGDRGRWDSLWLLPTDGSGKGGLLRFDQDLQADVKAASWFRVVAWPSQPDSLILFLAQREGPRSLWRFDLATGAQHRLYSSAQRTFVSASPAESLALIASRVGDPGPIEVSLVDLESGQMTDSARVAAPAVPNYISFGSVSWSSSGQDVSFLFQVRKGFYAPAHCYPSEGRIILKEGEPFEYSSMGYDSLAWADGDSRLVLARPKERSLKVLDRDLAEVGMIRFPDSLRNVFGGQAFGKSMLFQAAHPESVWRLDLDTKKWKRIW
jgi:ABC-type transport system involved in multi-copper enzyme maturation permease subunit